MSPRQIVASYFLIQAIGTAAWWGLLIAYPPSVKWFQPADWPADSLLSFWLADFVLIIAGAVIAATGVLRRSCWAGNVVWAVAVVTWYPGLFDLQDVWKHLLPNDIVIQVCDFGANTRYKACLIA